MSHSSPHHPQHMVSLDRHHSSTKLISPSSKIHITSPTVRSSHSLQNYPHQVNCPSAIEQNGTVTAPSTPISSHSLHAVNPLAYTPNNNNNNNTHIKYDLGHHNQHHQHSSSPHHHGQAAVQHSVANNGNYLHSAGGSTHASMYGLNVNGVKTEGNGVNGNYDYMNSCLQTGYFGGTFNPLAAASNPHHMGTDLSGYHHQHNVIQAAKLMATS